MNKSMQVFVDAIPDIEERCRAVDVDLTFVDDEIRASLFEHVADRLPVLEGASGSDFEGLARDAHTLKGMGTAVGYPEITFLGQALDKAANASDSARCDELIQCLKTWLALTSGPSHMNDT